jgi:glycosyltransferase involved in cell wall biosynthesis
MGIREDLRVLGQQERLEAVLQAADLFLLPSRAESFGLAALEAMACEVPVVASHVGGLPEVIEHGVSGFLHAPEALDEMAESAVLVLHDAAKHHAVAQAACARVRNEFCAEKIVPMYERCYQSVIERASTN